MEMLRFSQCVPWQRCRWEQACVFHHTYILVRIMRRQVLWLARELERVHCWIWPVRQLKNSKTDKSFQVSPAAGWANLHTRSEGCWRETQSLWLNYTCWEPGVNDMIMNEVRWRLSHDASIITLCNARLLKYIQYTVKNRFFLEIFVSDFYVIVLNRQKKT